MHAQLGKIAILAMLSLVLTACSDAQMRSEPADSQTEWVITSSVGLDALLLIGAASGDDLQASHYGAEIAQFRASLSPRSVAILDRLGAQMRASGQLVGPALVLLFSGADHHSLDAILTAARDPDGILRPPYEASAYWDAEGWPNILAALPGIIEVLEDMQASGFEADWAAQYAPDIDAAIAMLGQAVSPYDIIPEQARLLGRDLDPRIELIVVNFSQPYGIRIQGQRFLAHHSYPPETQLRIAAHEIFHPPFDNSDADLLRLLEPLENDPWMISIVEDHNPGFGYNSFLGVVNEDSTKALDQIVSERLGFARDMGQRLRHSDDGMHMLAAALYHAMVEDGFAETGGVYEDWLKSALERGLLTPDEVRRRAAEIVGQEAVDAWGPGRVDD